MNNFKIFPFQKNKYFYGKLLTVRDFELEQKYMDEKRYIINRVMFGSGIAAGLKVSSVDEQTIVVEPGFAIDNLGREIVVPELITQKLSFIKGFESNRFTDLYLCLEYKEYGKERAHSVTGESSETEDLSEYNRIQESYELVIREEPEEGYINKSLNNIYKDIVVYEDEDVCIEKKYPYIINPNEVFEVILEVHKKRIDAVIEFNYVLKSEFSKLIDGTKSNYININFKEQEDKKEANYKIKFLMEAEDKVSKAAIMYIDKNDFVLKIDKVEKKLENSVVLNFKITDGSKKLELLEEFNETSIDDRFELNTFEYIYLAKIEIIPLDSSYIIEKVISVPFNQYIYNSNQLKNISLLKDESSTFNVKAEVETELVDNTTEANVDVKYDYRLNKFKFKMKMPRNKQVSENIATGTFKMDVGENLLFGKSIISEEINHGLGLGPVCIHVGVEQMDEWSFEKEKKIYYGDPQTFYKSDYEADENIYTVGAIAYPSKGTFRIGLRVQTGDKNRIIKLRWWAYRGPDISE